MTRSAVAVAALLSALALASPASAAKTLVSYEQSGGIAGIRRFKLARAELHALKRDLRDARFSTLLSLYDSEVPIADGINQTVRYAGHRVTVSTGGRPPARLRKVLDRLSRVAARAR